ncbi:MAG: hypothetical protein KF833_04205 [Verrucomicrobiae bacterium]|nr:hypothetical protein [Verrucomicrobiae bacterium]
MKGLHLLNLFGVLALAALCVAQWSTNRVLNLDINRLEQSRLDLTASLRDLEKAHAGLQSDLEHFRERFAQAHADAQSARTELRDTEARAHQLERDRDRLQLQIEIWTQAVADRDERLEDASRLLQSQAEQLRDAVTRFNELADRHNQLVQDWNQLQSRLASRP